MKKSLLFLFFTFLVAFSGSTQCDELPALSRGQRAVRFVLTGTGAVCGALSAIPFVYSSKKYHSFDNKISPFFQGWLIGLPGAGIGYTVMDCVAFKIFAWRNGISYRIQKIAFYYDLNVDTYKPIFKLAECSDTDALRKALSDILIEKLGDNHQEDFFEFLTNYQDFASYLLGLKKHNLGKKEKVMIHLIQIGAAIENLYFKSKPSLDQAFDNAVKMYQQLGLYEPFAQNNNSEGTDEVR